MTAFHMAYMSGMLPVVPLASTDTSPDAFPVVPPLRHDPRLRVPPAHAPAETVRAPLAGAVPPERAEDDIDDPLARQRTPANRRPRPGVQDRALGHADLDGAQAALVQRDVDVDEAPDRIDDGRVADGDGAVVVPPHLRPGPGEVVHRGPRGRVDGDPDAHRRPVVEVVRRLQPARVRLGDLLEEAAHCHLGVGLDGVHVPVHHPQPGLGAEFAQQHDAALVRRRLRLQVRDVVGEAAGGAAPREGAGLFEDGEDGVLEERAGRDDLEGGHVEALLPELAGLGHHGGDALAADVGVVAAGGDVEGDLLAPGGGVVRGRGVGVDEDGGDNCQVREVGAAPLRVVREEDVAGLELAFPETVLRLDRELHGPQVDRDVRGVGDELSGGGEDGAGEVEAFLDGGRDGGALEGGAHLLGDGHEAVGKDGELDRVDWLGRRRGGEVGSGSGEGIGRGWMRELLEKDVGGQDVGSERRRDEDGLGLVDEQRRAGDDDALGDVVEAVHAGFVPGAIDVDGLLLGRRGGWNQGVRRQLLQRRRLLDPRARAPCPADLDRFDDDVPLHREGKLAEVRRLEPGRVIPVLGPGNREVGVGAKVPQHQALVKHDRLLAGALRAQLRAHPRLQRRQPLRDVRRRAGVELPPVRLERLVLQLRLRDAVRRQQRGELVDQDAADAELVRDVARVLAAGPAEGHEVVVLGREAAASVALRMGRDMVSLATSRKPRATSCGGLGRLRVEARRELGELLLHDGGVQGGVRVRAEDGRERGRDEAAEEEVRVRHRQGPAFAVARGTRVRAGALGADGEEAVAREEDRAAARGDRGDVEHRDGDGAPGDGGLREVVVLAVVAGHVGAGAAHVEADDGGAVLGVVARPGDAHDAAGGAAEEGLVATELGGGLETAVGAHEVHAPGRDAEARVEGVDVAPDDGVEVGLGAGGRAAVEELDGRGGGGGGGDEGEAELGRAGDGCHEVLVGRVEVGVHEADGEGRVALVSDGAELGPDGVRVRAAEDTDELAARRADEVSRARDGGV
ncbi:LOW QUALITY PROTEIN: uncharacterised protein [Colletotrichum tofieldiae]|nr:LOW QUALITY PROTEIN: uncharacterised protein [Colletotrichum tofieldiae]